MATVTNEQIISALMTHSTVEAAADAVGMSRRAIYSRMKGRGFNLIFQQAREGIIQGATAALQAHISDAVQTIAEIMQDPENPASVRLQAAALILTQADKFTARVSTIHKETGRALTTASSFPESISSSDADEEFG